MSKTSASTAASKTASRASTRRTFLRGAALATAASVSAPSVVRAQGPINMRWQSTWPSKDRQSIEDVDARSRMS